jgi:hypothetical protein
MKVVARVYTALLCSSNYLETVFCLGVYNEQDTWTHEIVILFNLWLF